MSNTMFIRNLTLRRAKLQENGRLLISCVNFSSPSGSPGRGAGRGGGSGGSVRESGGGLGEYGAAQEELYFFNKQKEQIEKMKKKLKAEKPQKTDN